MTAAHGTPRPYGSDRWFEALGGQSVGAGVPDPDPPVRAEARERLRLLAVPEADVGEVLDTLPDPDRSPAVWRSLVRCHRALFSDARVEWPNAPGELGVAGRYFYVHVYLLALPAALERQALYGVPPDVVRATFADLGAKVASYRRTYGVGGFDRQTWIARHFRGALYRLGRLQFERAVLDARACGGRPGPAGPADGEPVLDVHVPGDGPMTPEACDASLGSAVRFFARHFPGTSYRYATCHSWLLDERLRDHLPADSNIVRFQSRFRLFGRRPVCDDDVLGFVFHAEPGTSDLDRFPRETGLQRAVLDRLRSGGHWRAGHGWTFLPPAC